MSVEIKTSYKIDLGRRAGGSRNQWIMVEFKQYQHGNGTITFRVEETVKKVAVASREHFSETYYELKEETGVLHTENYTYSGFSQHHNEPNVATRKLGNLLICVGGLSRGEITGQAASDIVYNIFWDLIIRPQEIHTENGGKYYDFEADKEHTKWFRRFFPQYWDERQAQFENEMIEPLLGKDARR